MHPDTHEPGCGSSCWPDTNLDFSCVTLGQCFSESDGSEREIQSSGSLGSGGRCSQAEAGSNQNSFNWLSLWFSIKVQIRELVIDEKVGPGQLKPLCQQRPQFINALVRVFVFLLFIREGAGWFTPEKAKGFSLLQNVLQTQFILSFITMGDEARESFLKKLVT